MELLQKNGMEAFEEIYALLEKSFPPDERRTKEAQRRLFEHPAYRVLCFRDEKGLRAFMALWDFDDFCFLEHFAVDPELRGQGVGSSLLAELGTLCNNPLVLEVESPENDLAVRRIGFYRRNGFFTNDYPYVQPAYSKDKKALPMILMTRGRTFEYAELERIKKKLYISVYGIRDGAL